MGKLEDVMDRREANEKRTLAASAKAQEAAEKKRARQDRLYVRKEFNRLFKRLRTLVTGHWDRYGWGWTFKFKGHQYWISYDSWFSAKTPGDVDDYDMSGQNWVLKSHFNFSSESKGAVTLHEPNYYKTQKDNELTEAVLNGLKELKKNGYGQPEKEEDED